MCVTGAFTGSRKHALRLLYTSELSASSGLGPSATSAFGHATAAPAFAVAELGFMPINGHIDITCLLYQGWVFVLAKSIFARTVEKTGKNRQ